MLYQLKRHPIPMEADLRDVLVLTYAADAERVAPRMPPGVALDLFEGHAMLAVALVRAEAMRPAGMPRWVGQDFFLAGFRAFARFRDEGGRTRRGLRILRSYTDRTRMRLAGNLLTHYDYRRCATALEHEGDAIRVRVSTRDGADLDVAARLRDDASLPAGSVFADWREARRWAGPLPYTFDHERETDSIIVIKGDRVGWAPRPVEVDVRRNDWLTTEGWGDARLSAAFYVDATPYRWGRGERHRAWKGDAA